jgi:hypothetical protein
MSISEKFLHHVPSPMATVPPGLQSTELVSDFAPPIDAPHLDRIHAAPPHIMHNVPPMFQNNPDVTTVIPTALHSPLQEIDAVNKSHLVILDRPAISGTPATREQFKIQDTGANHIPVQSTSVVSPIAHPPPHIPPTTRQPLPSPYTVVSPSLASAAVGSSPSHSIPSNGVTSPVSENVMSPITENNGYFNFGNEMIAGQSDTSDENGGSHRRVVQDLFTRCWTSPVSTKLAQTCFVTG